METFPAFANETLPTLLPIVPWMVSAPVPVPEPVVIEPLLLMSTAVLLNRILPALPFAKLITRPSLPALVLLVMVLIFNILARVVGRQLTIRFTGKA